MASTNRQSIFELNGAQFDSLHHDIYCWNCQRKVVPDVDVHCFTCHHSYHRISCAKKWFPRLFSTKKLSPSIHHPLESSEISRLYQCRSCIELEDGIIKSRTKGLSKCCTPRMMQRLFYYALITIESKDQQNHFGHVNYEQLCKNKALPTDCIYRPIDIDLIKWKNRQFHYKSLESFMYDFDLLHHNTKIVFGPSSRRVTQMLQVYNFAVGEVDDIRSCIDCYRYYYECDEKENEDSFLKPCVKPHSVVWTRHHGYDWPAKVFHTNKPGFVELRYFGTRHKECVKPVNLYLYSQISPSSAKKHSFSSRGNHSKVKKILMKKFKATHIKAMEEVGIYLKQIGEYFKDNWQIPRDLVRFDSQNRKHYFINVRDHYSLKFRFRNYDKESRKRMIRRYRKRMALKSQRSAKDETLKVETPDEKNQKKSPDEKSEIPEFSRVKVICDKKLEPEGMQVEELNNEEEEEDDKMIEINCEVPNRIEHLFMKDLDLTDPIIGMEVLKTNCFEMQQNYFEGNQKITDLFSKINQQIERNNKMFAKCVAHEKTISALKKSIKRFQNAIQILEPKANYFKANEWCKICFFPAQIYCCRDACYCSEQCQQFDRVGHQTVCMDLRRRVKPNDNLNVTKSLQLQKPTTKISVIDLD